MFSSAHRDRSLYNKSKDSLLEAPDLVRQGLAMRLLGYGNRPLRDGRITIRLPNGGTVGFPGVGPHVTVTLHRWRALRRLALGGATGFAESFVAGDWDSSDLSKLIDIVARNQDLMTGRLRTPKLAVWRDRRIHNARRNSHKGSAKNIAYHYDLGNEFYARWLDPSLSYSSAIFDGTSCDLAAAQRNKYRRLFDLIDPKPGDHLLEIGCGWGELAITAARERGLKVTGITLSQQQLEHARRRIFDEGLTERIDIQLRDYRDVRERFDHIVSVEMIEAVGEDYWPTYFQTLNRCLRPGGRIGLQAITIDENAFCSYRSRPDFIQKHIFPGGMLPTKSVLERQADAVGLKVAELRDYGEDYAKTLRLWRDRFLASWADIAELGFDERFKRLWTYYLAYCEAGFRAGRIDLVQASIHQG